MLAIPIVLALWCQQPAHDPPDPTIHRLSTQSGPLTSSRPAPPSPAVSRRTSGFSRTSSRPISTASSRPTSTLSRPVSTHADAPPPTTPRPTTSTLLDPTPAPDHAPTPPPPIQIRDFAFPPTDARFSGQGPHVPRANRPAVLARRLAPRATHGSDDDYEDEDEDAVDREGEGSVDLARRMWEEGPGDGWARWGFERGWSRQSVPESGFPSRGDLDRNFGFEDGEEEEDMEIDGDDDDDDDYIAMDDVEGEPLFPGLYRALYAFEPEGTAEMKLDEDQLVRVIGRGGGVGWAVVVKDGLKDLGVHALVPESYLESVRLDGEE